jgi:hypothetical protein
VAYKVLKASKKSVVLTAILESELLFGIVFDVAIEKVESPKTKIVIPTQPFNVKEFISGPKKTPNKLSFSLY